MTIIRNRKSNFTAVAAIVATVLAIATVAHAQTYCDMSGGSGSQLYGCWNTGLCGHDNTTTANNYCLQLAGGEGVSTCVPASQIGGGASYQYNAPVNDGTCPKGSLALAYGAVNQYGRYTCTNDASCANSSNGQHCVQTIYRPGAGYKECQA